MTETAQQLQRAAAMAEVLEEFASYAAQRAGESEQAIDFHCIKFLADGIRRTLEEA